LFAAVIIAFLKPRGIIPLLISFARVPLDIILYSPASPLASRNWFAPHSKILDLPIFALQTPSKVFMVEGNTFSFNNFFVVNSN